VFFPLVFVDGIAGQLFSDQALTVTFALAASLVVALTLIPMLAAREKRNTDAMPSKTDTNSHADDALFDGETAITQEVEDSTVPISKPSTIWGKISHAVKRMFYFLGLPLCQKP
jgi:HAE1 family hydrophobic/amphiphilic exporter-1